MEPRQVPERAHVRRQWLWQRHWQRYWQRHGHRQRGSVTAETAVVLPSVLLVLAMLVWLAAAAIAQLQCVDAARAGARAAARGEAAAAVRSVAMRTGPAGAVVRVATAGDAVSVEVKATVRPLGSVLSVAPALDVRSAAVAAREAGAP